MNLLDILLPYQRRFFTNQKKRKMWIASRQCGKSFTLAALLVYKALTGKSQLSLCISTGARASSEILRKAVQFAEAVKVMTDGRITYTCSFEQVKFSTGARVLSLPSSTDGANLRGFTASCVCIDEASFIDHLDLILQAIGPTLSRDPEAELLMTTTPGGMHGKFWEMYQQALDNEDVWYVQHTTIHDAVHDGLVVDLDALHSLCPDPDVFAQEYECKFLSEYGSLIDVNLIDWYDNEPVGVDGVYLGMDIGSKSDRSAITTVKTVGSKAYISDIVMLNKVSYENQLKIVKDLHDKNQYRAGLVDETGIGSAFAEFCTKKVSSKICGLSFTAANKTPMFERLRSMIFDHKLMISRKLKPLIETDFRNVSRVVTETGQVKYVAGRDQNGHSDATSSIVLALEAMHQNPVQVDLPNSYQRFSRFA